MTQTAMQARIAAIAAAQKAQGQDLNEKKKGGTDFPVAAAGACRVRFMGLIELGVHTTEYQGKKKTKPRAQFTFELSGPNHPPVEVGDGKLIPQTITFDEVVGFTEKNGYMKLFDKMKTDKEGSTTFWELLGEGYRASVFHPKPSKTGKVWPKLRTGEGYTIKSKTYQDEETMEFKTVKVAEALGTIRAFPWDFPALEDWDALHVDGAYDDGSTKNKLQEKIKRAENFVGSPIYLLLCEAGREAECELDPTYKEFGGGGKEKDEEEEEEEDGPKKAPAPQERKTALTQDDDGSDPLANLD